MAQRDLPDIGLLDWGGFVGRDQELALIEKMVAQAAGGRGGAVLISGEAGIGKSRLAREALSLPSAAGFNRLAARFHELESNIAYLPFRRILPDLASGPLGPELSRLLTTAAPSQVKLAEAAMVGDRAKLNQEVWECLREASRLQPLLLVLDDVQWADLASLSLVEFILPRIQSLPVVLLLLRRIPNLPTASELPPGPGSLFDWRLADLVRCDLRGLSEADVEQLLAKVAPEGVDQFGRALARATHRRAAGNPLFVEELLRHLVETGELVHRDRRWQSRVLSADELELPPGLTEVITRRLALIPEARRQVLSYAAVLGSVFDFDILAAMTDVEEEEVILAIEHAVRAQLIAESPSADRAEYEFRHEVVRQVLYESLSKPRRQKLHLRAATTVEVAYSGDSYEKVEQVARHCQLAGRYCDPEKALRYSIEAADHAQHLYAYDQAIVHLEWAVRILQLKGCEPEDEARLFDRLAWLYFMTGLSAEKGKEYTERAIVLYRTMGADELAAKAHTRLMWQYSSHQESLNLPKARQELKAAEEVLSNGADGATTGYFHIGRAGAALWELRTSEGLEASRSAMEIATAIGDEALWSSAAGMHGWHVAMSGGLDEGMALLERAWQVADRVNNFVWTFRAAWYRGTMSYLIGDPLEARNWFQRESQSPHLASALTQRRSLLERVGNALSTMGNLGGAAKVAEELHQEGVLEATICFRNGEWDRAEVVLLEAKAKAKLAGDMLDVWRANYRLAQLYQIRGDFNQAAEILVECLEITADHAVVLEAHARAKLTQILSLLGNTEASSHCARLESIVAQGGDWRGLMGHVLLARAAVSRLDGDAAADRAALEAAFKVFDRYQNPWECIDILLLLADGGEADDPYFAKAEALALRIGASRYWAVRKSYLRPPPIDGRAGARAAESPDLRLSPREVEVLTLLGDGKTNKEIADLLVISRHTVARHVSAILRKGNIGNRTAAASLFAQLSRSAR